MIVYSIPIRVPILSSSVVRATHAGITAIKAPLVNPYMIAKATTSCADRPVTPSTVNDRETRSTAGGVVDVDLGAMTVAGSHSAKQNMPERNAAGVSVLKGPTRSAKSRGKKRPRTDAPFMIASNVEKEVEVPVERATTAPRPLRVALVASDCAYVTR